MKIVSLFNEQVNFLFGVVPYRENFVNITFPFSRFCFALPNNFFFNECHEDVGKATAILVPIAVPWVGRKLFPQNWKEFSWSIRKRA